MNKIIKPGVVEVTESYSGTLANRSYCKSCGKIIVMHCASVICRECYYYFPTRCNAVCPKCEHVLEFYKCIDEDIIP